MEFQYSENNDPPESADTTPAKSSTEDGVVSGTPKKKQSLTSRISSKMKSPRKRETPKSETGKENDLKASPNLKGNKAETIQQVKSVQPSAEPRPTPPSSKKAVEPATDGFDDFRVEPEPFAEEDFKDFEFSETLEVQMIELQTQEARDRERREREQKELREREQKELREREQKELRKEQERKEQEKREQRAATTIQVRALEKLARDANPSGSNPTQDGVAPTSATPAQQGSWLSCVLPCYPSGESTETAKPKA